jgi:hypothetical protein
LKVGVRFGHEEVVASSSYSGLLSSQKQTLTG